MTANFLPLRKTDLICLMVFLVFSSCQAQKANLIQLDPKRWYQLNSSADEINGLFDGKTNSRIEIGKGNLLDRYEIYYPLLDGEEIQIDSIKFFDGEGTNENAPFKLYTIDAQWRRVCIATFVGTQYNKWVGPDPDNSSGGHKAFVVTNHVEDARYLVISTSGAYPTEMELYGSYTRSIAQRVAEARKNVRFEQMIGINLFEWDFENPDAPLVIDEQRFNAAKNFTQVRHYLDWEKLERSEGAYTFNPSHSGGWNYDVMYAACKAEGIDVLVDLKTIPAWMQETYPAGQRDNENIPARYGSDLSNPQSYKEQAEVAFQFAARYGSNSKIDPELTRVNNMPRWNSDPVNVVKIGLNLIKYIECDNERDKWWKGRKAYQTGREYAANLSAFYDGNMNAMGPGVGVKNADPAMQVVMGGVATTTTDYLRGMIDWCKEFRGLRANGEVNVCWDVINYHFYSNDGLNSQSDNSTRGSAPEVSGAYSTAKSFVDLAHQYLNGMPVWVTETGYDENAGSPQRAIEIKHKSALETQADWALRTALLYARAGIERVFFYQMYDENAANPGKFASCGLMASDRKRKPAADYLYQANKLIGKHTYISTLNENPIVDKYELNGQHAYVLVKPSENGSSVQHVLELGDVKQVYLYQPKAGQDTMSMRKVSLSEGRLTLLASETPTFVIPVSEYR